MPVHYLRDAVSHLMYLPRVPWRDYRISREKFRLILSAKPYSIMPYSRLSNLYELVQLLEKEGIDGNMVECGVMNGGSAAVLASAASANPSRHLWLFDSWQGLPQPSEHDVTYDGRVGKKGVAIGRETRVRNLIFRKLKLNPNKIHFVRGWFDQTIDLYKDQIGKIALLHLDCDWYDSVKICLDELFDRVVDHGVIVIDDYGHWQGSRRALEEFARRRQLNADLQRVDVSAYFRKPSACSAVGV